MKLLIASLAGLMSAASAVQSGSADPSSLGFTATECGAHFTRWSKPLLQTNSVGRVSLSTNSVVQIGSGLNRLESGAWVPARAELSATNGGVLGRGAGHVAFFADNINSLGSCAVRMPSGTWLRMHFLCLAMQDSTTNVVIGRLKDSSPRLFGTNTVVYPDAVDGLGGLRADVRYEYTRAGVSQEILLRQRPPAPATLGLSDDADLVVVSEITEGPEPEVKETSWFSGHEAVSDQSLDFGMKMVPGRAFSLGEESRGRGFPVRKSYEVLDGRRLLFERVRYSLVKSQLLRLPSLAGTSTPSGTRTNASIGGPTGWLAQSALPPAPAAAAKFAGQGPKTRASASQFASQVNAAKAVAPAEAAGALASEPGFVLDWTLVQSGSYMWFDGSSEYEVNGECVINGAYFFNDVVIRYDPGSSLRVDGGFYNYANSILLTSVYDITNAPGDSSWDYGPALAVACSDLPSTQNIQVRYCSVGIIASPPCPPNVNVVASPSEATKGLDTAAFIFTRDGNLDEALTVNFQVGGTAEAGLDYTSIGSSVEIPQGEWSASVTVTPTTTRSVAYQSSVALTLQPDSSYGIGSPDSASVTIWDPNAPGASVASVPEGMVAWWKGQNDYQDSFGNNHGTAINGGLGFGHAMVGQGFRPSYPYTGIQLANQGNMQMQDFTVEAWVKRYSPGSACSTYGDNGQFLAYGTGGYGFGMMNDGRLMLTKVGYSAAYSTSHLTDCASFHHVAVVKTGGSATFYIDGVADAPVSYNPGFVFTTSPAIGTRGDGQGSTFLGSIDELSVYSRAVTASEIASVNSAARGGKAMDTDNDGLPDWWELKYFGNLAQTAAADPDGDGLSNAQEYALGTSPAAADTDGDGLTDSEELTIWVDCNHHELGYLNPLDCDTGSTGILDGQKDSDHDGISNLAELRQYHSEPWNPNTFNSYKTDAEYLFTAEQDDLTTEAYLHVGQPIEGVLPFTISGSPANANYDLYFVNNLLAQRWQWRRVYSGIQCDSTGAGTCKLKEPDPSNGYFIILDAKDDDGDGLSNGYEAWFKYGSRKTSISQRDSDRDQMLDGWEVAYGIDPTDDGGANGAAGNIDADAYPNYSTSAPLGEYNQNDLFGAPSFDPLKPYGSTTEGYKARPVVSISSSGVPAIMPGGTVSFTIHRSAGLGADLSAPLKVYYSVGGGAAYQTDYFLSPAPDPADYPRVFSATVREQDADVTITVTPLLGGAIQAGLQTILIKLTPYGVAADPQTSDPQTWKYVVDLYNEGVALSVWNGILINLVKDADGALRIKPTSDTAPLPFINVANSARGTMARIYTGSDLASDPSGVVAEYLSAPNGRDRDPSRTTVDRYGNVWVGNRGEADATYGGSICEYGIIIGGTRCNSDGSANPNGDYLKPPFIYNTCVDRHGATVTDPPDGLIRTSRGSGLQLSWANTGNVDSFGGVSTAEDEAILRYLRVAPLAVRTVVVDANNNLWVGSHDDQWKWNEFIDTGTGMQVTGRRLSFRTGGYGGVIDGSGAVWSSGYNLVGGLMRFLPSASMPVLSGGAIRDTSGGYGVGVDPNSGDVWQPLNGSGFAVQLRADHCRGTFPIGQTGNRGIVIDGHGSLWVGGSDTSIFHLTTAGAPVGSVLMSLDQPPNTIPGDTPIGATVDGSGMVWAICQSGVAMRIDPRQNPDSDPSHVPPIGKVVEAVDLGAGSGPYNYSDMSGFVTLSTAQPSGVWDHVEDAAVADTLWTSLTMDATVPAGTKILVEVRAANSITELPTWPFIGAGTGGTTPPGTTALPSGVKGRFIEVRANLTRNFGLAQTPELRALSLEHGAAGCAIQITSHPASLKLPPGGDAMFSVAAQVPSGLTATYQWLKNGVALSDGGNISGAQSATLHVNPAQHTAQNSDVGRYSVRVGTTTGCSYQLESGPARLHILGSPPAITQELPGTQSITEGQNAILSAAASCGTSAGETPLFYQWRLSNEPIGGASGSCAGTGCGTSLTVAGQCADAGVYSVVFWNQFGQISTVNCEVGISGHSPVVVTPPATEVTGPNQSVTLTATVCLADVSCVQWYITKGGQKMAVPGANSLVYTLPTPITCDEIGTYTVSVADRGWNAYEASAEVTPGNTDATISLSGATLHPVPENLGTGSWVYQWSFASDGVNFAPIAGATAADLALGLADTAGYYKLTARRTGGTAVIIAYWEPLTPSVTIRATLNASLDVTYATQAAGSPWAYQWYFAPQGGGQEQPIPGGTSSQYTIQSVGCAHEGTYRAQVNCGGGSSASAFLGIQNSFAISFATLHITPDNVGTGTWTYQWSVADDVAGPYTALAGETDATIALFADHSDVVRYYKCAASRSGASVFIIARFYPAYANYDGPSVTLEQKTQANLDVSFIGGVAAGPWDFQWYFAPLNVNEQPISGATSAQYAIQSIGCAQRGTYRVSAVDGCGHSFTVGNASQAGLGVTGCP